MRTHISAAGTKDEVLQQATEQTGGEIIGGALEQIVQNAPGTHVSLSMTISAAEDERSGSLSLSLSSWTPAP